MRDHRATQRNLGETRWREDIQDNNDGARSGCPVAGLYGAVISTLAIAVELADDRGLVEEVAERRRAFGSFEADVVILVGEQIADLDLLISAPHGG